MAESRASESVTDILKSIFIEPGLTLKATEKYARVKSRCNLSHFLFFGTFYANLL